MKKEFLDYIQDIIDAINNIEAFVQDVDYEHFATDTKTSFAVVRAIQIIGEAAKNVPPEVRVQYPEIPWKVMTGMRDRHSSGKDSLWSNCRRVKKGLPFSGG